MASKGGVVVVVSGEDKTGEVIKAIDKHLGEMQDKAKETSDSLGEIGKVLEGGLAAAGIAIGVREIVGGLKDMIQSTMETGVELGKLREETGISAEKLSLLKYVAAETGVGFEALVKGFKNISTAVHAAEEGNPKATKAFADLGISVADLRAKGDDMMAVLTLVADKFRDLPAGIDKNAIATELFKKSGQDLIPVLNQLSGALEEGKSHAAIFTDEDIEKMKEMHESVAALSAEWQKFELGVSSWAAPGLTSFFQEMSSGHVWRDALSAFMGAWNPLLYTLPDAPALPKAPGLPPPDPKKDPQKGTSPKEIAEQKRAAAELASAQERNEASLRQLADAGAKLDETRAKVHAQTMLSILEEMHKQGLVSEADYLTQKETYQNAAFDAERTKLISERRALTDQMNALASGEAKTGKDRIETESKLNAMQAKNLEIEGRLVELDAKRATFARQIADAYAAEMAKPIDMSGLEQAPDMSGIFGSQHPNVKLASWTTDDTKEARGEAEKFAHGVFDPLFNMSERWDQKWKQMRSNLLNDLGQAAESQIFGALFGDSSGSGGKGLDGSKGNPKGHNGLLGDALGSLGGLFHHKGDSTTSNGGLGSGAGTIASAAASAMQIGGGAAAGGSGGIQVVLNNQGTPMQVSQTQQSGGDGGEQQVIQIMLKQLETNGPVAQGIAGLLMLG